MEIVQSHYNIETTIERVAGIIHSNKAVYDALEISIIYMTNKSRENITSYHKF